MVNIYTNIKQIIDIGTRYKFTVLYTFQSKVVLLTKK